MSACGHKAQRKPSHATICINCAILTQFENTVRRRVFWLKFNFAIFQMKFSILQQNLYSTAFDTDQVQIGNITDFLQKKTAAAICDSRLDD